MSRRFSRLEAEVLAILKAGGDPLQSKDQAIVKYWGWRIHKDATQHNRATTRTLLGTTRVIIFPFAVAGNTAHTYAELSTRAYNSTLITDKPALFDWKTGVAADTVIQQRGNFSPAKAIVRQKGTTEQSETSKITGRSYKTKSGPAQEGFVFPFGRGTGDKATQSGDERAILTAIKANFSVSFKPEVYREPDNVQGLA